jgi:hypothetical protein
MVLEEPPGVMLAVLHLYVNLCRLYRQGVCFLDRDICVLWQSPFNAAQSLFIRRNTSAPVCTENPIRIYRMIESASAAKYVGLCPLIPARAGAKFSSPSCASCGEGRAVFPSARAASAAAIGTNECQQLVDGGGRKPEMIHRSQPTKKESRFTKAVTR